MTADYRHWDTWNEGIYNHVFTKKHKESAVGVDILGGAAFDGHKNLSVVTRLHLVSDSKRILYVSKQRNAICNINRH
jgi:hypothetical protein